MKIAFLNRYQDTSRRGAETFVNELLVRLSKNHEVKVLSGKDADSLEKVLQGKFDVVVPVNGRIQSLKMSLGRLIGKYKLLISGHSGIGRDDIWNIAVCKPDVFVALTGHMQKWAKKWAWGSNVIKIPNGIDLNKFSPYGSTINIDLPRPIILSVGALAWYKHHEMVIKAVRETKEGSLLIVGEGPEKERLEKLGKDFLGERFKIASFDYVEMPKVYRSCDLFTLPSWDREAFGIVYLEALASGLGVVAPDDITRREIIGNAGVYADVGNSEKFAYAIVNALKVKWQKKSLGQAAKFSWDIIANEYQEVFQKLVKNR